MEYVVRYSVDQPAWYAMKASYGKALAARSILESISIESYVPMRSKKIKVGGRNKISLVPAIPNLIFVRADRFELDAVKSRIDYLHNMLKRNDVSRNVLEPIVISDEDMAHFIAVVQRAQDDITYIDTLQNPLSRGMRVRITEGEFEGYEGILIRIKGSRAKKVVLDIQGLVTVEIPAIDIKLVEKID